VKKKEAEKKEETRAIKESIKLKEQKRF